MAWFCGSTFVVCVFIRLSVRLSVRVSYVRPSLFSFPDDNLSNGFSSGWERILSFNSGLSNTRKARSCLQTFSAEALHLCTRSHECLFDPFYPIYRYNTYANCVGPDETAHNKPSHQDPHCLQFCFEF